jgi:hypothetical protein
MELSKAKTISKLYEKLFNIDHSITDLEKNLSKIPKSALSYLTVQYMNGELGSFHINGSYISKVYLFDLVTDSLEAMKAEKKIIIETIEGIK